MCETCFSIIQMGRIQVGVLLLILVEVVMSAWEFIIVSTFEGVLLLKG